MASALLLRRLDVVGFDAFDEVGADAVEEPQATTAEFTVSQLDAKLRAFAADPQLRRVGRDAECLAKHMDLLTRH